MIAGHLFTALWRISGIVLIPFLFAYKKSRRHIWRVPIPTPGRTWIHGASIGEHRIATALLPHIGPAWCTYSSWRSCPKGAFPAPLDVPGVIGPWLDRARPGRLILLEGELWPGWLIECRKRQIPVVVMAARKGPGWYRWQKIKPVFSWLTRDLIWMYSDDIGDLKQAPSITEVAIDIPKNAIVGASTRHGDEAVLITAWTKLPQPRPKLILAPRHLERADSILQMTGTHSVSYRSHGLDDASDIWVIDTHGELAGILAKAHIAFIGGTFDSSIGGHSPSEAAAGGCHIVHGPHIQANASIWEGLQTCMVADGDELSSQIHRLGLVEQAPPNRTPIDVASIVSELPEPIDCNERVPFSLFWPLVLPWKLLSQIVRMLHRRSSQTRFVVVGGLANGGAGRTPAAAWLAENIENSVVLSAGYRRSESGSDIRFGQPHDTASNRLGDELEMMRRRGHPVISAPKRTDGIAQCKGHETPIIDGGLGDPRLHGGYRIACIDGLNPGGRGPFPVGRLRMPWNTLQTVDAIWVSYLSEIQKLPKLPEGIPVIQSHLKPIGWIHKGQVHSLDAVKGEVDVVVGIANPERFVCTLLDLQLTIRSLRTVGDHAALGTLPPGAVITEKDAARLPIDSDTWALKMELIVHDADPILEQIREHCQ